MVIKAYNMSHHSKHNEPSRQKSESGNQVEGKTKMIDGKMYKEVSETKTEVNEQGHQVRRIYIKYVPVDDSNQNTRASSGYHQTERRVQYGYSGQGGSGTEYYQKGKHVREESSDSDYDGRKGAFSVY